MKYILEYLSPFFKKSIGNTISFILILLAIHSVIAISKNSNLSEVNYKFITFIYFTIFLISFLLNLSFFLSKKLLNTSNSTLIEFFDKEIEVAYDSEQWTEVIKLGNVLSRPLWVFGKYEIQKKIGRYVEIASSHLEKKDSQARALIDNLGWTKYEMGEIDEAILNIQSGLTIAKENNLHYLEYKALRHLSGIEIFENRSREKALEYLEQSETVIKNISDSKVIKKALAGLYTNQGLVYLKFDKNGDKSESLFIQAQDIYKKNQDNERFVKMFPFIAESHLLKGNIQKAKDILRKGETEAKKEGRVDTQMRCMFNLGVIHFNGKHRKESLKFFKKAYNLAHSIGNVSFQDKCSEYIKLINC